MGLFNFLSDGKHPQVGDSVGSAFGGGHDTSSRVRILPIFGTRKKNNKAPSPRRICRVEELERREMLAANPIDFGAVYHENSTNNDLMGDTFHISFEGGDAGTQLETVTISLDKNSNGAIDPGEIIFHDGLVGKTGSFESFPFTFVDSTGFDSSSNYFTYTIVDSQTLVLNFKGFTEGNTFVFMIDVDEVDEVNADGTVKRSNAVVEGGEFHGSKITGVFTHENYYNTEITGIYHDDYPDPSDPNYNRYLQINVPDDDYVGLPHSNGLVATAGAFASKTQTPLPITISGYVYEDNNKSNTFDIGEKGIDNVLLTLEVWNEATGKYESTGKTTKTANGGAYVFNDVLPGKYRIVETQPDGYESVGSQPGKVDGVTRGQSESVNVLAEIELVGGDDSVQNNFGEIQPGALSGYVYEDNNDDGVKGPTEAGINNVTVSLYVLNDSGEYVFVSSTTTKSGGYYEFTGLSPNKTYMVKETQPTAYLDGKESIGSLLGELSSENDVILGIHVGAGQFGTDYNFGELKPSTISGHVAADKNDNNVLDSADQFLAGVPVHLYDINGNLVATTQTDENGFYKFENLRPGIYKVVETQPEDYYDGPDFEGSEGGRLVAPDTITDIVIITAGTHATDYDFLEYLGGCIEGYVYEDDNNNGIRDPGEKGIGGVVITLYDENGKLLETYTTDDDGKYIFCNLEPKKEYTVKEAQPNGYCDGQESQGTVAGNKYGDISVNDTISGIPVISGKKGTEFNFGELKYSSIAGYVYEDLDNDGLKETGEPGIEKVTVQLWVWNDTEGKYIYTNRFVETDASGYYKFDNLCPYKKFRVVEIQPEDYISGKNKEGDLGGTASDPNDWITDIVLEPDNHGVNYNFGELREAKLSGYVYSDVTLNNGRTNTTTTDNGNFDSGENGIKDVVVQLWMWNDTTNKYELAATTKTDGNGYYEFAKLAPGRYQIVEIQPEDYFDGKDSIGSLGGQSRDDLDTFTEIVVTSGANGTEYNFGELPPGKISGYVFQDGDTIYYYGTKPNVETVRDGVKNAGDRPISGVTLVLCNASGDPLYDDTGKLITTTTNANGYYEFDGLPPENYGIREIQPSDYENGINTVGTWAGLAQNSSIPNGFAQNPGSPLDPTRLATLAGNDPTDLIFMVNLNYGEHAANNNFSEVLYAPKPPDVPPPPSEWSFPGPPDMPIGNPVNNYGLMYTPPTLNQSWTPGIGGGGIPLTYSWHLSVINAGYPRSVLNDAELAYGYRAQGVYMNVSWQSYDMGQTQWIIYNTQGKAEASFLFGPGFGTAVAGDFNGDGIAEMAVFFDGYWLVDLNGNGTWDDDDLWIKMGSENDQPVVGDWDGDGKTDIGVFGPEWPGDLNAMRKEPGLPTDLNQKVSLRPTNVPPDPQDAPAGLRAMKHTNRGRVRLDVIDHVFRYGAESDRAIVGDFNGDGTKQIGVYRNGTWHIDYNGNGQWDAEDIEAKTNHKEGDFPIVGDFTGEGVDRIGIYTPSTGRVTIDTNGNYQFDNGDLVFYLEGIDDVEAFPVVGDFNGDGIDQISLVKHIEKIPMHTRVVPQRTPMAIEAPSASVISSEFIPGNWGSSGVE